MHVYLIVVIFLDTKMNIPDNPKPRAKSLELTSFVASFNDTKIQQYMNFVNFKVVNNKINVLPDPDSSLTQFYYLNFPVLNSSETSVFAALQTAKPTSITHLLLPPTSIILQNRVAESHISPTEVGTIFPKSELEVRGRYLSNEKKYLNTSFISAIQSIGLGFLETLKKNLEFKLDFSCEFEHSKVKLDLKTHFKCN